MVLNPRGSAAACKALVETGTVTLFVSQAILAEVVDVLNRPRFRQIVPDLTAERIDLFVEEIAKLAIPISNVPEEFHYERDPEDEPYINLALAVDAGYIVSLDNDLLDLMKPAMKTSSEFHRRFPMLRVVKPITLLYEIEQRLKGSEP